MIFDKYAIRDKYESHIPCYPHPTGSERFILLTSDNVELWAKDLLCCTPGFSIDTPPLLLKYETCKKRADPTTAAASIQSGVLDTSQLVAIATAVAQAQITRTTTVAYLDFAGIVEDQDGILRILVSNRIDQYHLTAGINRSNTAVRAVLEQPCSTGGRTGTVRPKHLPAGRTGLSNQFLGPVAQDQPGPVGQICPTSWLSLWLDSVRPNTGRTRLFEHRSSSRVRPVNAGSASSRVRMSPTINYPGLV
ncbi:hypothetical protein PCASD_07504 [Puccinia coronata f. sp. avenae]|uniref:Uncharacterized protein n=1 Tax=Puccinia coronata f. sp. avenae TaxID=200324 RepID=A0A2N5V0H0_9BASI|nr:hypothetical protein PCASD_07504 [Puccinia coronata f. sp. avenae]